MMACQSGKLQGRRRRLERLLLLRPAHKLSKICTRKRLCLLQHDMLGASLVQEWMLSVHGAYLQDVRATTAAHENERARQRTSTLQLSSRTALSGTSKLCASATSVSERHRSPLVAWTAAARCWQRRLWCGSAPLGSAGSTAGGAPAFAPAQSSACSTSYGCRLGAQILTASGTPGASVAQQ